MLTTRSRAPSPVMSLTIGRAVLRVDRGLADKHSVDPLTWGAVAEAAMAARVRDACHEFGSAGRALAIA